MAFSSAGLVFSTPKPDAAALAKEIRFPAAVSKNSRCSESRSSSAASSNFAQCYETTILRAPRQQQQFPVLSRQESVPARSDLLGPKSKLGPAPRSNRHCWEPGSANPAPRQQLVGVEPRGTEYPRKKSKHYPLASCPLKPRFYCGPCSVASGLSIPSIY